MKHRKLRIAWSVAWGVVAVLLVVLWVRSYWWDENFVVPLPGNQSIYVRSLPGSIEVIVTPKNWGTPPWKILSTSTDQLGTPESPFWGLFNFRPDGILIPYWFSILIAASTATFPWLRWRFSLRTLLIATTLVAMVLGMIVWMTRAD